MGDGLRKATLEALCSRGPWHGSDGWGGAWTLTADDLRAFCQAVPMGTHRMCEALGIDSVTHRKADRALRLLRNAGLIYYDRAARTWRQTGGSDG